MKNAVLSALNSLHQGQSLAVQVDAFDGDSVAWIGVYPLDTSRSTTLEFLRSHQQPIPLGGVRAYRIRRFEVSRALVERNVWISEADLSRATDEIVYGDDALQKALMNYGTQIGDLALPSKSDYPI